MSRTNESETAPSPAAAPPAAVQEKEGSAAVRSYLTATLTPVLLKAIMALEEADPPPTRPIQWVADYLENYSHV